MALLTPSGEVAVFKDDDQFATGQSQDKCGPEAVAVFWHSTKPGTNNPYTAADIHQMAASDYIRFIGPDVTSDHNGTSNQTLYDMLAYHHFAYKIGPADITWVKGWLAAGYPVIIGVVESSVHDQGLGGSNPYNWDTTGLTHVIIATGPGAANELLCRDTANIGTGGPRPGPRRYDATKLQLISATMVVPSWLPVPASSTPPKSAPGNAPTPPAQNQTTDWKKQAESALASLTEALNHL